MDSTILSVIGTLWRVALIFNEMFHIYIIKNLPFAFATYNDMALPLSPFAYSPNRIKLKKQELKVSQSFVASE
jgi:hypothetical protein